MKHMGRFSETDQLDDRIVFVPDRQFNDLRYAIDSEPLRRLGWTEKVTLTSGLWSTVKWYVDRCK